MRDLQSKPEKFSNYESSSPCVRKGRSNTPSPVRARAEQGPRAPLADPMDAVYPLHLKAHVKLRAEEVGEVPRPVEFKGQVANDMMDPGSSWRGRTWYCVN